MRRIVPCIICACTIFSIKLNAQIKGNPPLPASPKQTGIPKTASVISPDLQSLYNTSNPSARLLPGQAVAYYNGLGKYIQVKEGSVVVDITVKGNMATAKASLQQLGLQITGVYGRVISGAMPINALPQLTAVSTIQFARPAYRPMHQSAENALMPNRNKGLAGAGKTVVSQGDTAQGSYLARKKYHVNGKGVKVGILSDSYNNLGTAATGVLNGELPGPANPFHFTKPVDVLEDLADSSGHDEGRAIAEIIHDIAPGAEIAFHTANLGQADFAQGIQDLADKGCKIITDDILYYMEPFFQDGIIAQSVDQAKKKGVVYFSAAGNNANNSYESDYRATNDEIFPGSGTAHNFSFPGDPPRYYQPVFIPPGGSFIASFQWDQPFFSAGGAGSASDLDIYLIDMTGNIVAAGTTDNIISGDPIEFFGFDNTGFDNTFFLVITKVAGPDPSRIKYNMYKDAQFYTTTPAIPGIFAPTLVGHAKADGAIATAAVSYLNTPAYGVDTAQVERFSSLAGVANYFDAAGNRITPLVRNKPDITAPDGGNTSFFAPSGNADISEDADSYPNFFGTSAAAPHAAGVAALMIEAEKLNNLTPDQIKGVLTSSAADMDNLYTSGFDKSFDLNTGYGLIRAEAAVGSVKFPGLYIKNLGLKAICSTDPATARTWKITNPNPFTVNAHWLLTGSNQQGAITAPPGETVFSTALFSYSGFQVPNIVILDWDDNFGFTRLDIENSSTAPCNVSSSREQAGGENIPATTTRLQMADVFPNPATNTFRVYLSLADQQQINLQLFSIDGKKLLEKQISQSRGIVPIDAAAYKPGVYILNIKQGSFNKTIKLIKQ